jgi:hypothetical protein
MDSLWNRSQRLYEAASRKIQITQGSLVVGLGYDQANRDVCGL